MTSKLNKECCKNCIYCAEVKKWPAYNEVATNVCIYFVCTEDSKYIHEVHDNDRCEVFRHKDY